jgi:DNA polymerase-3 subunit chi
MTRVDFYLLDYSTEGGRDTAVCKLAHKAFRLGHHIYILTADDNDTQRLNQLLWTFHAGSFIPHGINTHSEDTGFPILIGKEEPPTAFDDVLITLAPRVPDCFSRFQRVAEVVNGDEDDKARGRERFRFYRDRGYMLQTHKLALDYGGAWT